MESGFDCDTDVKAVDISEVLAARPEYGDVRYRETRNGFEVKFSFHDPRGVRFKVFLLGCVLLFLSLIPMLSGLLMLGRSGWGSWIALGCGGLMLAGGFVLFLTSCWTYLQYEVIRWNGKNLSFGGNRGNGEYRFRLDEITRVEIVRTSKKKTLSVSWEAPNRKIMSKKFFGKMIVVTHNGVCDFMLDWDEDECVWAGEILRRKLGIDVCEEGDKSFLGGPTKEIVKASSIRRKDWNGLCVVLPPTAILFTLFSGSLLIEELQMHGWVASQGRYKEASSFLRLLSDVDVIGYLIILVVTWVGLLLFFLLKPSREQFELAEKYAEEREQN
ncbi:hypothetical protein JD969_08535 [Planctomycetota bacterium]|nr:hypothetical protein JD969_08535 [Planctomycetota bacterium]